MSTTLPKISPMMAQWESLKKSAPNAILLFRLGDFYEAFYDDALLISKELDLTLTKRQEVPMAGVPFHTCENYVDRLVAKGYHVAVAEQMEDPSQTKGIVQRKIVRVVTPGTLISSSLLPEKANNFLVALTQLNQLFGLAILDLTTAEFRVVETEDKKVLQNELVTLSPAEVLVSHKFFKEHSSFFNQLRAVTQKEEWQFDPESALDFLLRHFKLHSLDGFGLKGMLPATCAAGTLLRYVKEDLNLSITHVKKLEVQPPSLHMALDGATLHHLELVESTSKGGHSLLSVLDETSTPMGGRLLRQWLTHPLLSVDLIRKRHEAIAVFLKDFSRAQGIQKKLKEVRDLERLIMRIETGYASPRDLLALRLSLEPVPSLILELKNFTSPLISENSAKLKDPTTLCKTIETALLDEPPLRINEGGIFKNGYNAELDELRLLKKESHTWVAQYQTELREKSGIKNLKVGYTRAFGYYIEVTHAHADKLLPFAQRKQTLVNAERFISHELKEFEQKLFTAEEKMVAIELELFHKLRDVIARDSENVRQIAQGLAVIDLLLSLATCAREQNYTCPTVDESDQFTVVEGRHPVLERVLPGEKFISNDLFLNSSKNRLLLITGPNMAGKSTYLRQVALIAIMAQMGSYVPAKSAHVGIIDKVFTRIGASDDLTRGQSTFMVEMTETANILHNATSRSLVLLDEIGRGTSTYDGISIARAVAEWLLSKRAKTLFATHYWELTKLEEEKEGAVNFHVAVDETQEGIVFLHKIVHGSTDKSYGIHVARLAGLPPAVIRRAQELLIVLEKEARHNPPKQLELFEEISPPPTPTFIKELQELDVNNLTPLQALLKLTEWKNNV